MSSPPLAYLRTFEAAARHESFARAAAELHVTPAAVSQQIRLLEDRLQTRLFVRGARNLRITREGRDYAASVGAALERIEEATRALSSQAVTGPLRIGTFPSFALHWLLPRLTDFRARHRGIDPQLSLSTAIEPLGAGGVDVTIRFGAGKYPGCNAELLMREYVFPACSPALLEGRPVPARLEDLAALPLIDDKGLAAGEQRMAWEDWLGDHYTSAMPRISLPDGLFTMQAALLGQGAAIVRQSLAGPYLREGRLVRLSKERRATDYSYWLVTPQGEIDPKTERFKHWLFDTLSASSPS
ncbi:LysR family transcriptional regulator [Sphingopyxis indica]|uniref:LysR substrate-binding domain-containing protein n=1 Tax=Sphingopyxis indica TaxID=436663 RepID=UPI0029391AC6|nr:LysR substrate-binding domain-containing protein [Sphingopyxis indica]WOF42263.1 LysR family transcriptional regulator [Sphingopyxis indica]